MSSRWAYNGETKVFTYYSNYEATQEIYSAKVNTIEEARALVEAFNKAELLAVIRIENKFKRIIGLALGNVR
jgi:hypothetical protein